MQAPDLLGKDHGCVLLRSWAFAGGIHPNVRRFHSPKVPSNIFKHRLWGGAMTAMTTSSSFHMMLSSSRVWKDPSTEEEILGRNMPSEENLLLQHGRFSTGSSTFPVFLPVGGGLWNHLWERLLHVRAPVVQQLLQQAAMAPHHLQDPGEN